MLLRTLILILFLTAWSHPSFASAKEDCELSLQVAFHGKNGFSYRDYRLALESWKALDPDLTFDERLRVFYSGSDASLESLLAIADSVMAQHRSSDSIDFKDLMKSFQSKQIQLRSGFTRGNTVKTKFKLRLALRNMIQPRYRYRGFLRIKTPRKAPQTEEEFWGRILRISNAFRNGIFVTGKNRVSWFSLPVGPRAVGYPAQGLELAYSGLALHYSIIVALEKRGENPTRYLPKRDRHWRMGLHHLELAADIPMRFINPFFYNPFLRLRPNQLDYEVFKNGALMKRLTRLSRGRLRLRWFTVAARRFVTILALQQAHNIPHAFDGIEQFVVWGENGIEMTPEQKQKLLEGLKLVQQAFPTDEEVEEARQELWEKHSIPVRRLEEEIKKTGDPTGRLQKKLDKAIADREWATQ